MYIDSRPYKQKQRKRIFLLTSGSSSGIRWSDWDSISTLCSSVKGPIFTSWLKQRLIVGGNPSELSAAATNSTGWVFIVWLMFICCIREVKQWASLQAGKSNYIRFQVFPVKPVKSKIITENLVLPPKPDHKGSNIRFLLNILNLVFFLKDVFPQGWPFLLHSVSICYSHFSGIYSLKI